MAPVYWEHVEGRIPPNVSEETRSFLSLEYPHESAEWVIAEPRRTDPTQVVRGLRAVLAALARMRRVSGNGRAAPQRP